MAIRGTRPNNRQISAHLFVRDTAEAIAFYQQAFGAEVLYRSNLPVCDTFFGDRYGQLRDPFGHVWELATVKEVLTPEQIDERMMAQLV